MSDTGLYGSLYEQLRTYADRFDFSIIALNSDSDEAKTKARRDLATLLTEIADKGSTNPAARFIATILNQELAAISGQGITLCATLAKSLQARTPTPSELSKLEQIASVIDKECSSTLARMRGHA